MGKKPQEKQLSGWG